MFSYPRRLLRDRRGSAFVTVFGLMFVFLTGAVMVGADISNISNSTGLYQTCVDIGATSAMVKVWREQAATGAVTSTRAVELATYNWRLSGRDASRLNLTPVFSTNPADGTGRLTLSGTAAVPRILAWTGINETIIAANATAGTRLLKIVLVLDRSGSMWAAIGALQAAVINTINSFQEGVDYVGIVSFSNDATIDYPLQPLNKANAIAAVNALAANGGTNVGRASQEAMNEMLRVNAPGALEVIFYFGDGKPTGSYVSMLNPLPGQLLDTATDAAGNPRIYLYRTGSYPMCLTESGFVEALPTTADVTGTSLYGLTEPACYAVTKQLGSCVANADVLAPNGARWPVAAASLIDCADNALCQLHFDLSVLWTNEIRRRIPGVIIDTLFLVGDVELPPPSVYTNQSFFRRLACAAAPGDPVYAGSSCQASWVAGDAFTAANAADIGPKMQQLINKLIIRLVA